MFETYETNIVERLNLDIDSRGNYQGKPKRISSTKILSVDMAADSYFWVR